MLRSAKPRQGLFCVAACVAAVATAAIGATWLPTWWQRSERRIAAEALTYLDDVRLAQQRFRARHGAYARSLGELDLTMPPPTDFSLAPIRGDGAGERPADSWSLTLTRSGWFFAWGNAADGGYRVTLCETGFDPDRSTVDEVLGVSSPPRVPPASAVRQPE